MGRCRIFLAVALLIGAFAFVGSVEAQERGYQARACGFDLDGDGVRGEPGDDCNICDGVTTDPDGDGKNEDLIYVDCGSGNDSSTCGSPSNPCKSIQHAWGNRADGPGDGAEDIICFTGVCRTVDDYRIPVSGVSSGGDNGNWYNQRPASGNQVRAFRYPANPTMLVGWDKDNDGRYPPFDNDDVSVLDGKPNSLSRAFWFAKRPNYVEMAHFTARDYGRYASGSGDRGFISLGASGSSGKLNGVYIHDLQLAGINQGKSTLSGTIVLSVMASGAELHWIAFENLDVRSAGGWFIRGGVGSRAPDIGPFRYQNISYSMHANPGGAHAIKMWGNSDGVEILDNVLDANPRAWNPTDKKTASCIMPSACSHNWDIANNECKDFRTGLWLSSKRNTSCHDRSVNDIRFVRNVFRNTYEWDGVIPILVHQDFFEPIGELTCNTNTDLMDYVVANNFLSSTVGYASCYVDRDGNNCRKDEGTAVFVNNTCAGKLSKSYGSAIRVGFESWEPQPKNLQQNYVIWNNIVTGMSGGSADLNVKVISPTPSNWSSGNNVFTSNAEFAWGGNVTSSLSTWKSRSGSGAGSRECAPSFVNASAGDYHLSSSDSCATDNGARMSSIITMDVDSGLRPSSNWDIGADEFGVESSGGGGGGGEEPPPPPVGGDLPAPVLREVLPLPN